MLPIPVTAGAGCTLWGGETGMECRSAASLCALTFTRGSGNRVTGLVMDGGRVQHLGFTREEM